MTLKDQKKELQKKVNEIAKDLKKNELFGNKEIIKLNHEIDIISEQLKSSSKCPACNGKGEVWHDCDCDLCEFNGDYIDCDECCGDGVI